MKFGLINTYSYNNVGDAAIYAALTKMLSHHEVYTTLVGPDGSLPDGMRHQEDLSGCDGFVSVGGDIFNNARPWSITRNFLKNLGQLKKAPDTTLLFGQSIPASCRGLSLKLLAEGLKKINSVTVRDQESYELLKDLGVHCRLSFDSAFVLKCSEEAVKFAHEILESIDAPYSAVISLREFNSLYPVDNQQFVEDIAVLSQQLLKKKYQPVLLIQSSVSEMDSDWVIAKAIRERCPDIKILDLVNYSSKLPSWELLQAVLQVARVIVAVRYHTAVLALAAGRTPYNLYYSNKGADLSHRLGIQGGDIKYFNPTGEIDLIVKSGLLPFDANLVRNRVQSDFMWALDKVSAQHQLAGRPYEFA